ncbi:MAG TPA: HAD family phosphatase [Armatimonadota bacterium]
MSAFELLIFDMDDTLIASAETWGTAEARLFTRFGQVRDPRVSELYKGMNAWDVGRVIYEQVQPAGYSARESGRILREYLLEEFSHAPRVLPGADALLRAAATRFPLAVASGSPLEVIESVLARNGWTDCFRLLVSSESVPHGKPAPDVFLETAARCGCPPHAALVFEDSLHGVRAAKRAGMTCFVVPSNDDPRIPAEADRTFSSLHDITLDVVERYPTAY